MWYYNSESGEVEEIAGAESFVWGHIQLSSGTGWHSYATQNAMLRAVKANHWPTPTTTPSTGNIGKTAVSTAQKAASAIPGVGNIDDVITFLKQGSIWERAAEMGIGTILLYIGIKAMTNGTAVGNAASSVSSKVKKAAYLAAK